MRIRLGSETRSLVVVVGLSVALAAFTPRAWADDPKPKPPAEKKHHHRDKKTASTEKPTAAPVAPVAADDKPAAPPGPPPVERAPAPPPPAPGEKPTAPPGPPPADKAPAPAADAKPAPDAPAAPPAKTEKPKKPKTPWSTYSASDGKYAWAEPSGWILDEAHSIGGLNMTWNEPDGGTGTFRIATYPKTGASLADLVKAASYGGTPRASKAWMCAQGEQGDLKIAVAARVLESGDFLLLVLSAPEASFKWLGGLPGVRLAANAVVGFKPHGADWKPEQ
jgi:hypothetical protein